VAQLRHAKPRFEEAGLGIALVGMGTPEEAQAFKTRFAVPFPVVADPQRELYHAFDLPRMSPLGFLSPTLALRGLAAMAEGHTMGLPQGDVRQLPGVFIIDGQGRSLSGHYARDPADHPEVDDILASWSGRAV
jgi:hypothetical protein